MEDGKSQFNDYYKKATDLLDYYKKATDLLLKMIKASGFTVEDFYTGQNFYSFIGIKDDMSMGRFHIKECPGWAFGIWWKSDFQKEDACGDKLDLEKQKFLRGDLFAQYEDAIDKFKPSRSALCENVDFNMLEEYTDEDIADSKYKNFIKMIKFIKLYPEYAFERDCCGTNFNFEIPNRIKMKWNFWEYKRNQIYKKRNLPKWNKKVNNYALKLLKLIVVGKIEINDAGENVSPRYSFESTYMKENDIPEHGIYGFENDYIYEKYNKYCKHFENKARKHNISVWFPYLSINFYDPEEMKKYWEEIDKEESIE